MGAFSASSYLVFSKLRGHKTSIGKCACSYFQIFLLFPEVSYNMICVSVLRSCSIPVIITILFIGVVSTCLFSIPVIIIDLFIRIISHRRRRWDHPTDLVHRPAPVFHHLIKYKRGKREFDFQSLPHLSWVMALPQKCLSFSSSAWTSSLPSSLLLAHSYTTILNWVKMIVTDHMMKTT